MDIEGNPTLHEESAKLFIDFCTEKFRWRDLSKDVVMDVGCGVEGFCGKAVLDKFPDVGGILGIDVNPEVVSNFIPRASTKMVCECADIENSDTLQHYKDKMTKVVSTNVFHHLREKEKAFRNIFELLKPEGEAAVLFVVDALIDEWFKEMLKIPKWKAAYKDTEVDSHKRTAAEYKEMVENIGFRVIFCKEKEKSIRYPSPDGLIEKLLTLSKSDFNIPSELIGEFIEDGAALLLKLSPEDANGRPFYRQTELPLLLKKPS